MKIGQNYNLTETKTKMKLESWIKPKSNKKLNEVTTKMEPKLKSNQIGTKTKMELKTKKNNPLQNDTKTKLTTKQNGARNMEYEHPYCN